MKSNIFDRFFYRNDAEEADEYLHDALEFSKIAYFKRLVLWIETEAMRPVRIDQGKDMVVSAARQNAFLEVREKILTEVKMAQRALQDQDGQS
ncbi:MAG: hypothetical protein OEO77_07865 [Acidimicrobiia bacterium]|nr:hypothetical protein [Acidimicrobiia bacterium]